MRTIKFRAWDLDNQEMYYQSETKFNEVWTIDFNGIRFLEQRTIDSYPGGEYHEQKEEWVEPNQELMQFTGVKDLRGNEIYEGDIVTCDGGYETSEGSYDDCEDARCIEWSEETLQFVAECKSCRDSIPMYEFDYREIIGNIYQNPELLA